MKNRFAGSLIVLAALCAGTINVRADDAVDHTAPSYDMKGQSFLDLEGCRRSSWTWRMRCPPAS